jgi:ABC-type polar amino acid transport system ATPase subunit
MSEILTIKGLSKSFHDEVVLEHIDLTLNSGDIKVLIGKSGSGKSTLLKCINQLEQASNGSIDVMGQHFDFSKTQKNNKPALKELRKNVGMVFQHFCLWPHLSVLKNLSLAPVKLKLMSKQEAEQQAEELLHRFELSHKASAKPSSLSGGQQQRVSIARSLMLKPKIMLFDEPTSALDPEMTQEVLNIITELKSDNMAMLLCTHEIGFAKAIADEIYFLQKGRIIESGTASIIDSPQTDELKQFLQHTYH